MCCRRRFCGPCGVKHRMRHPCATLIVFDVPSSCVVSPYKKSHGSIHRYVTALSRHLVVIRASLVVSSFQFIWFPYRPHYGSFLRSLCRSLSTSARGPHLDLSRIPRLTPEKRTIWFSLVPSKHAHRDPMCSVIWILGSNTDVICGLIYGSFCVHI